MNNIADKVTQGTSALFLMVGEKEIYEVIQTAKQIEMRFEIITTSLSAKKNSCCNMI